ncbi:MAG TPA: BON domain-containing protein [Bryobacteraceae bacterium]|nr:BON domain-containing protein [Bryobacteraceae bacterium]
MKPDTQLRRDVEDELDAEPGLDASSISVSVSEAIVTLSGHVPSYSEKLAAERCAARVEGVGAVASEVDIRLPDGGRVTDEDIARAALNALAWNSLVPPGRVKVEVTSGWITLEGDLDWHYQKIAAHDTVCHLRGVTGVTNKIILKPVSMRIAVEAHVQAALRRHFGRQLSQVHVETRGDHVILRGSVHSLFERGEVERAAWTTPGVCHVDNNLKVEPSPKSSRPNLLSA